MLNLVLHLICVLLSFLQLCQYILDEAILAGDASLCNVICTQPRRISAISVSSGFDLVCACTHHDIMDWLEQMMPYAEDNLWNSS